MTEAEFINVPPIASAPTDQHAQNTWILGRLQGTVESMNFSLGQRLDDIVRQNELRNGRLEKAELRIIEIEKIQAQNKGKSEAFSMSWSTTSIIITLLLSAVALILKFIKAF